MLFLSISKGHLAVEWEYKSRDFSFRPLNMLCIQNTAVQTVLNVVVFFFVK